MNKREKLLVTLLVSAVVLGAYIIYLMLPLYNSYKHNKKVLDTQKYELNDLRVMKESGKLEELEMELNVQMEEINVITPSYIKLPEVYLNLINIKNSSGVRFDRVQFNMPKKNNEEVLKNQFLSDIPINISMKGEYEQVEKFIYLLSQNERKFSISHFQIEKSNEGGVYANLLVNTHAFIENTQDLSEFKDYNFILNKEYGKSNPFK